MTELAKTPRELFQECLRRRREYRRGGMDWEHLTRSAAIYLMIMRRVPSEEWEERLDQWMTA